MIRRPPRSPLFPSPTLFRSRQHDVEECLHGVAVARRGDLADVLHLQVAQGVLEGAGDQHARAPTRLIVEALRSPGVRSEEHTSELQSLAYLVCRLLLEKKKT